MIIKRSKNNFKVIDGEPLKKIKASPEITEKIERVAHNLRKISPRSDDFLYFSIIFMKAAEASLLDEDGSIKKLADGSKAWGYFDQNWKWHGNVKPHKNNNSDIFPESELKKAASKWIGLPLCRDHESSSVDGIRGIILDTHYDEKFKQVVGLCALDKVNYPDLANKVKNGLVRYGSMGTAVERSICYECCNVATTPDEYCNHVNNRSSYGEINVSLKPIEYSLVVQPAEPGAVLLKCIASLNKYKEDFQNIGVDNVESMLGKLSERQAEHLDKIMKTACYGDSCSIDKRNKIALSFLKNNGFVKEANYKPESTESDNLYDDIYGGTISNVSADNLNFNALYSDEEEIIKNKAQNPQNPENLSAIASANLKNKIKNTLEDFKMSYDKRKVSKLRERSLNRRAYMQGGSEGREPKTYKDEGASANNVRNNEDKHMKMTGNMGGNSGVFPGDMEKKQKLSRASLRERSLNRRAYMQGGSEGREPKTYKDEGASANNIRNNEDKHMKMTGSMGGDSGVFPGDMEKKQKLSRASFRSPISKRAGYTGPNLKTRVLLKKRANGSVDRKNSLFQVFAGNKKVISVSANDIFGTDVNRNWKWMNSKEYSQEVCKEIRASGIPYVKQILKGAQAAPAPAAPAPAAPAAPDAAPAMPDLGGDMPDLGGDMPDLGGDMPDLGGDMPDLGGDMPEDKGDEPEEKNPSELIDDKLMEIEELIADIKDLKSKLEDEKMADVKVNVNVGDDKKEEIEGESQELESLASSILGQLKTAMSELDDAADEMAMVSETYSNMRKLSSNQKRSFVKLASDAYDDAVDVIGQAKAVLSMSSKTANFYRNRKSNLIKKASSYSNRKTSSYSDVVDLELPDSDIFNSRIEKSSSEGVSDLIKEAIELRKAKRESLLKKASSKIQKRASVEKEAVENNIEDSLMERKDYIKTKLKSAFNKKQASQDSEIYKIKLRRAYDVGLEMQKKGMIASSKAALDTQVDDIMQFDDKAFEAFKRSIDNTKVARNVMTTDLGGINIGSKDSQILEKSASVKDVTANVLSKMWEK